jgi:hypothetical protein
VNTIEELLSRKSSGSNLESREYDRRDPSRRPRVTLYPLKVGTNFAGKRLSLGGYNSLTESVFNTSSRNMAMAFIKPLTE